MVGQVVLMKHTALFPSPRVSPCTSRFTSAWCALMRRSTRNATFYARRILMLLGGDDSLTCGLEYPSSRAD
eukprot:2840236-Pyramimonas_sp.AAC.1